MPSRFPSLKTLEFRNCNGTPIGSLVENNQSSLTSIDIIECKELVLFPLGLLRGNNILCRLHISSCQNFEGFTPNKEKDVYGDNKNEFQNQVIPNNSLNELTLVNCEPLDSGLDLRGLNSLRKLYLIFSERQKCISGIEHIIKKKSGIEYLPILETLQIGSFSIELESFPFPDVNIEGGTAIGHYFPSLCNLELTGGMSKYKCLPDQIQYITSLQTLRISEFKSLVSLPEWLGNLAFLRELEINNCENLKYLPSHEQMLRLTSLKILSLYACRVLEDRCKVGGEEAYKISSQVEVRHQTIYF
ncbi:hypothetical protein MKX03_004452 [Papaver bracteatum]|nr:hypothetical protein MKX03_004452 [Papaver bracteatum]